MLWRTSAPYTILSFISSTVESYQEPSLSYAGSVVELIELASQIDYVEKAIEITGIGYMSMVGIIAETGDLKNYEHAKQVLKMSGLSLKESSSGQKKGKKHISKRGRSKLRRNLKQISICLVGKNNFFLQLHNYYTTQREHPLTKLISIDTIKGKLILKNIDFAL